VNMDLEHSRTEIKIFSSPFEIAVRLRPHRNPRQRFGGRGRNGLCSRGGGDGEKK
jgi:hypothetical protein